jgi:asparagine synthase (glutamine-hydrolysing)
MPVVQDLMMRKAHSLGLNVTLNGHGPDEMLAGYPARHCSFVAVQYLRRGRLGKSIQEVAGMKRLHHVGITDFMYTLLRIQVPPVARWLRKAVRSSDQRYFRRRALRAHALSPARFLDDRISGTTPLDRRLKREFFFEVVPRYLTYEDGVSMASSVESRVPFLDHRIVEFSFSLDDADKVNRGVCKFILRDAMRNVLPNAIVEDNQKIYVESPFRNWLQGCLRPMVTGTLLGDDTLISELMNPDEFRSLILRVLDGAKCSGWELGLVWRMLTAEVWLRQFVEGSVGSPACATPV